MMHPTNPLAVGYNGNQLDQNNKFAFNIDYLITNLKGDFTLNTVHKIYDYGDFKITLEDFGTKVFEKRYSVTYKDYKLGVMFGTPRSIVIDSELLQFQFENVLFYTMTLKMMENIFRSFTNALKLTFVAVNRLDLALDRQNGGKYEKLMHNLLNGKILVSGRTKKVSPYFETEKGKMLLTGFSIGKRSSSRFLRVYNKSLEMESKPKEYIYTRWKEAGLNPADVWRFEYQINSVFFRDLKDKENENITWQIFNYSSLIALIQKAELNHFELKRNTEKTEVNKEQTVIIHKWDMIAKALSVLKVTFQRIKKILEPSLLSQKRLIKSLLREYYQSKQTDLSHIIALNRCLEHYYLTHWFNRKLEHYLIEFKSKVLQPYKFSDSLLTEHLTYSL